MQLMLDSWLRNFSLDSSAEIKKVGWRPLQVIQVLQTQKQCFKLSAGLDKRCPQSRDFLTFSLMFNHIFCFLSYSICGFKALGSCCQRGKRILAGDGFLPPSHSRLCKRMV